MRQDPPNRKPAFVICDLNGAPIPECAFPGYESREAAEHIAQELADIEEKIMEKILLG